jgi:hypothetical protein
MERTDAQKEASRLNGAKSHGPVTEEGKAASSQNARKYPDLESLVALAKADDPEAFERVQRGARLEVQPRDEGEEEFVERIARSRWRVHQFDKLTTDLLDGSFTHKTAFDLHQKLFDKLSILIAREERRIRNDWTLLRERRKEAKAKLLDKIDEAIKKRNEPDPPNPDILFALNDLQSDTVKSEVRNFLQNEPDMVCPLFELFNYYLWAILLSPVHAPIGAIINKFATEVPLKHRRAEKIENEPEQDPKDFLVYPAPDYRRPTPNSSKPTEAA